MLIERFRIFIRKKLQEQMFHEDDIKLFLAGYLSCALWTEEERLREELPGSELSFSDEDDEESQQDRKIRIANDQTKKSYEDLTMDDLDQNSIIQAYVDIKKFIELAGEENIKTALLDFNATQIGHDLWLTRNHHGSGFFDRGYTYETEQALIKAAHALGEVNLYIGDDIRLYFSNVH